MCYIPLPLFQLGFSSVIKIWDKSAGLLDALYGEGSRLLGSQGFWVVQGRQSSSISLFTFQTEKNEKLFPQRSHEHVLIISKKNAASSQTNIPHAYHWENTHIYFLRKLKYAVFFTAVQLSSWNLHNFRGRIRTCILAGITCFCTYISLFDWNRLVGSAAKVACFPFMNFFKVKIFKTCFLQCVFFLAVYTDVKNSSNMEAGKLIGLQH